MGMKLSETGDTIIPSVGEHAYCGPARHARGGILLPAHHFPRLIFKVATSRAVLALMSAGSLSFPIAPNHFEPLLTPVEAATWLGVHEKTAIRMARGGELPALRIGKHWRFRRSDLESWAAQRVRSGSPARSE